MLLTIVAFLIVLSILVLVHEFGHFVAAKRAGVKVLEFAFGFPPRLFSVKRGETQYSINLIPFGGYVKMLGELEHSTSPRAYENQSVGKRFSISIAGVVMNVILAWVILTVGFAVGMPPLASNPETIPGKRLSDKVIIADVQKDSPADKASLKAHDVLVKGIAPDGEVTFDTAKSVGDFTRKHLGQTVTVIYTEDDKTAEKQVSLSSDEKAPLGVALAEEIIIQVPWYKTPYYGLREVGKVAWETFRMLGNLVATFFKSGQVSEGVGGPVAIYVFSGIAIRMGLIMFAQFIAALSVNLALINILPFPALDGGRLIFIILEKIRGGKVVREEVENLIHTIGFIVLIILLIAISYRDIVKLF